MNECNHKLIENATVQYCYICTCSVKKQEKIYLLQCFICVLCCNNFIFFHEKYCCIEVFYFWTENLLHPDTYCEIPHPDIGKYFKEFTGQYYVMNSEKAQEYPDDDVKTRTTVEGRGQ